MKRLLFILIIILLPTLFSCKKKSAEEYMDKGLISFANEEYDDAIENYLLATSVDPKSALAHNYLGIAYRFKYNLTKNREYKRNEEEAFKLAIELDPSFWVSTMNLAATYYYDNRQAEAIPLFKKALEQNPKHKERADIEKLINDYESSQKK